MIPRSFVAIVLLLAVAVPARAVEIDRLERQLREAHYARIGVAGRIYVLVKPRAVEDGLAYKRIDGYSPQSRQAIFVGADSDSTAPFANPVPWSAIDRLESGVETRKPGAMWGGFLGLATGLTLGLLVRVASNETRDPGAGFVLGTTALTTVAGAGIGALFPVRRWHDLPLDGGAR